jgi:hypothetical protein
MAMNMKKNRCPMPRWTRYCSLVLLCCLYRSVDAQTEPARQALGETEVPNARRLWKPNLGQLSDPLGIATPEVLFYADGASPATYLTGEVLSMVWSRVDTNQATPDTTHRIDMTLVDGMIGPYQFPSEQAAGIDNYYLGHLPQGVEGVPSFARLVTTEAYPGIDLHYYSNAAGLKLYFVAKAGADATQPRLSFAHDDTAYVTAGGGLHVQGSIGGITFEKASVYRLAANGNRLPMTASGAFYEAAPGEFAVTIETHSGNLPVVVQIGEGPAALTPAAIEPAWGTFYGGTANDACIDMDVDAAGYLYVNGQTQSMGFPTGGSFIYPTADNQNVYIGRFNENYVREWMSTYGGDGQEQAGTIASDAAAGRVYMGGRTEIVATNSMPQFAAIGLTPYLETYTTLMSTGFLAAFDASSGERIWVTHLGGRDAAVTGLEADGSGNIYGVGGTFEQATQWGNGPTGGPIPLCGLAGTYLQTVNNPSLSGADADGFIFKFDAQGHLQWSTLWGGNGNESLYDIGIDAINNYVYVVGATQSTDMGPAGCPTPTSYMTLCNGGGYFQPDVNGDNVQVALNGDGMIARFDLDGRLNWSTFFGGPGQDAFTGVAVPNAPQIPGVGSNGGEVYVTGYTQSPAYGLVNCAQSFTNGFPGCVQGNEYSQAHGGGYDAILVKFDVGTALAWSTYLGSVGRDVQTFAGHCYGPRAIADRNGQLFVAGSSNSGAAGLGAMPLQANFPFYAQPDHGDLTGAATGVDGWVYEFSAQGEMLYGSNFGGLDQDYIQAIALGDGKLFVGGATQSTSGYPLYNPVALPGTAWYSGYPLAGGSDAHYAQLEIAPLTSVHNGLVNVAALRAYPNPATGLVNLEWIASAAEECAISLYNAMGSLVLRSSHPASAGPNTLGINLGELPQGTYLVSILSTDRHLSTKIVVR